MKYQPRILMVDIETTPNLVYSWDLYVPNGYLSPDNIVRERNVVCIGYKWLGERSVTVLGVNPRRPTDDKHILTKFASVLEEADAVVGHNGDAFDFPWLRTRYLYHGLSMPPRAVQIDTRKIAKQVFRFNSRKLEYLATYLKIGHKIKTDFDLWKRCLRGERAAHQQMKRYNRQDVLLLEKVYWQLAPHIPAKLNYRIFGVGLLCEFCGSKHIQRRRVVFSRQRAYQRYQCQDCGHWFRDIRPVAGVGLKERA